MGIEWLALIVLSVIFFGVNVADAITTDKVIAGGGKETNLALIWLFGDRMTSPVRWVFKLVLATLIIIAIWRGIWIWWGDWILLVEAPPRGWRGVIMLIAIVPFALVLRHHLRVLERQKARRLS